MPLHTKRERLRVFDPDGLDGVFDLMRAPVDAVQIGQQGEPGGDLAALQRIQQHLTDELDLQLAVQVQLAWRAVVCRVLLLFVFKEVQEVFKKLSSSV